MRPGLRDELITEALRAELAALANGQVERVPLDPAEAEHRLSRHLAAISRRILAAVPVEERPDAQVELANRLLELLDSGETVPVPPEILLGVVPEATGTLGGEQGLPPRPEIPLSMSDLLFNGEGQPTLGSELRTELASANNVDLLCAFVIWSGVRVLRDELAAVVERGGRVRVITTTYMGATQPRALDALSELGACIRVAFDARTTKLHAKSWLLERPAPLSTAFIGSSNLSHTALHEGLEWNVRLSEADTPHLINRMRATFETHWADEHFEPYDPQEDGARLLHALRADDRRRTAGTVSFFGLDVHPYPHQRRMLERLTVERDRHDRHRNLVVAATGTGKTVVAALDYRGLRERHNRDLSLLFVAHRRRILDQSLQTFRHVLHQGDFGELFAEGERPVEGRHVFASIQSLGDRWLEELEADAYDVAVVDEFHHAAAPTYRRLLDRLHPEELVGLTATPERMDQQDVTEWFGGRIAVELRLWEAIDQGFLAPFQYFGVSDGTDLSRLEWRQGGYVQRDLDRVITGNDARVGKLLRAIEEIVESPQQMRALGFCVSVEHANYMADRFDRAGLSAVAVSGHSTTEERDDALARLAEGRIRVVFSVDVLGEGVDVPAVDTVLLLRPTQSPTVLTQQLGRGLRPLPGKRCLTVIDLIGQQHRKFRFDQRLQALLDISRAPLRKQVADGFPFLPSGCEITLDRVSRDVILDNLRDAARLNQWRTLVDDLRGLGDVDLASFLAETEREPKDLYRSREHNWTRLRRDAGLPTAPGGPEEPVLLRAMWRLLHVDDPERVRLYREWLTEGQPPDPAALDQRKQRLLVMLHYSLWGVNRRFSSLNAALDEFWPNEAVRNELVELLTELDERSDSIGNPLGFSPHVPVMTHLSYSRDEVLAAFGVGSPAKPPQLREGVLWVEAEKTDLFFVTLQKSEREYSPTTMYRDYAISPGLFHWESQSTLRARAPTAQRYINHADQGSNVLIFVRERAQTVTGATAPYVCLGPASYVSHQGERPLSITWRLRYAMPESLFELARAVAAA